MAKVGAKPKLVIDDLKLKEIENMASRGLTIEQIAHYYGVTDVTLHKMKRKDSRIAENIRKGKSKRIITVSGALMKHIDEGNLVAIMFYLKTQAGWRENGTIEKESASVKSRNKGYKIDTTDPIEASKIYQSIMTGSYNNVRNGTSK